jgi:hypothetical protein
VNRGQIYGKRLLEVLRALEIPTHFIMPRSAEITVAHETDSKIVEIKSLATHLPLPPDAMQHTLGFEFRFLDLFAQDYRSGKPGRQFLHCAAGQPQRLDDLVAPRSGPLHDEGQRVFVQAIAI